MSRNQREDNNNEKSKDRIITIDSYRLDENAIIGIDEHGIKAVYIIHPDSINRGNVRSQSALMTGKPQPPYRSYCIDYKMAAHLPPGHRVVAENVELLHSSESSDSLSIYRVLRIANADKKFSKIFTALLTTSASVSGEVVGVQSWNKKAIHLLNTKDMQVFFDHLDNNHKAIDQYPCIPAIGFQVRALLKFENKWTLVQCSRPIEILSSLNKEKIWQYLNGSSAKNLINSFMKDVQNNFPDFHSKGGQFDIISFHHYRVTKNNKLFNNIHPNCPYYDMTISSCSTNSYSQEFFVGKNLACYGLIELTIDIENEDQKEPRDFVKKIFVSGKKVDVRQSILSFDGQKILIPHPMQII